MLGPTTELPLLAASGALFNQAAEVSIAARGEAVMVASIQLAMPSADAFAAPTARRIAVHFSADRGVTFGAAIDPQLASDCSDPVVRAAADGTFWLSGISLPLQGLDFVGHLASSRDGATWRSVPATVWGDKDWIAIDDAHQAVAVAAEGITTSVGFDGRTNATGPGIPGGAGAGFVDALGAHFVDELRGAVWTDGGVTITPPTPSDEQSLGRALGAAADGRYWLVRPTETGIFPLARGAGVVLDLWTPGDAGMTEVALDNPDTFHPAAAIDGEGRLHVVWYDTSGAQGVLKYARSRSSDLSLGLLPPLIVDDDACPGSGWHPTIGDGEGRRLREYIDLAVDGTRAHVGWTHAPSPPSRVHTAYVDF
jgi:hypothetical protein